MARIFKTKGIIKSIIERSPISYFFFPRIKLAKIYLSGTGLEIGALAAPLRLPRKANAKYVDIASRQASIQKFPELNPNSIVNVDYISDGFTLSGIEGSSFDFVIANHILEHSPNPVEALTHWIRVLKPNGILFCAVPILDYCFDKGRILTTFEHMLDDYFLYLSNSQQLITERNKLHYQEWLTISEPAILKRKPLINEPLNNRIEDFSERNAEIHFHTFTKESFQSFFFELNKRKFVNIEILEISISKCEVIAILKKGNAP